ncbi:hypothetical protein [Haloarchaeobius sp. DYHT-AS-18]
MHRATALLVVLGAVSVGLAGCSGTSDAPETTIPATDAPTATTAGDGG